MQALHGAQQRLHGLQHRRAQPRGAHGGGGAGAGQVVVHLAARAGHLLGHQLRQRAAVLRGGVGQDGQRRVHRVRQVAGLGAGALHHVGVFGQHMVELVDQRLQLLRKAPLQPCRLAAAHRRQARAQLLQRAQRQLQLHGHGQRQPQRQHAQRQQQHAGKALQGLGHQRLVGRHRQAQRRRIVVGQLQGARHGQQFVALGAAQRQHLVALRGILGQWQCQGLVPQRTGTRQRRLGLRAQAVDLPVQARQGLVQPRIARHGRQAHARIRAPIHRAAEVVELHHQLRLQLLGDVVLEQRAQPPARQRNADQHPGQRARQQAQAQRATAARAWRWCGVHGVALASTSR